MCLRSPSPISFCFHFRHRILLCRHSLPSLSQLSRANIHSCPDGAPAARSRPSPEASGQEQGQGGGPGRGSMTKGSGDGDDALGGSPEQCRGEQAVTRVPHPSRPGSAVVDPSSCLHRLHTHSWVLWPLESSESPTPGWRRLHFLRKPTGSNLPCLQMRACQLPASLVVFPRGRPSNKMRRKVLLISSFEKLSHK